MLTLFATPASCGTDMHMALHSWPQVRNSGVRTLFLAVGGQAPRFDGAAWRYCLWEVMFPLIKYVQVKQWWLAGWCALFASNGGEQPGLHAHTPVSMLCACKLISA